MTYQKINEAILFFTPNTQINLNSLPTGLKALTIT